MQQLLGAMLLMLPAEAGGQNSSYGVCLQQAQHTVTLLLCTRPAPDTCVLDMCRHPRFPMWFSVTCLLGGCLIFAGALHVHQDL